MNRGQWLKEKIKSSGFSQDEMADMVGFSRTTLFRYLKDPDMPYTKMYPVAELLKIDLRETFPETKFLYDAERLAPQQDQISYNQLLEMYAAVVDELNIYKRLHGELPGQKRD